MSITSPQKPVTGTPTADTSPNAGSGEQSPSSPPSSNVPPNQPPATSTKSDSLKNETQNAISAVQSTFEAVVENGLVGRAEDREKVEKCQEKIASAWKDYRDQKYGEALDKAQEADTTLSEIIQSRGFRWRFLNLYAAHWFIVLVLWFGVLVWAGYSVYLVNLHSYVLTISSISFNIPKILRLVVLTAIAGGLGAVLRQVYYVSLDVKKRQFKRSESIDILMSPFIGFLFGFLAYLVIAAGLLVATQKATPSSEILNIAVGFLLGFNWGAAHDYIKKVTTSVLGGSTTTGTSTQQPAQGTSPSG